MRTHLPLAVVILVSLLPAPLARAGLRLQQGPGAAGTELYQIDGPKADNDGNHWIDFSKRANAPGSTPWHDEPIVVARIKIKRGEAPADVSALRVYIESIQSKRPRPNQAFVIPQKAPHQIKTAEGTKVPLLSLSDVQVIRGGQTRSLLETARTHEGPTGAMTPDGKREYTAAELRAGKFEKDAAAARKALGKRGPAEPANPTGTSAIYATPGN